MNRNRKVSSNEYDELSELEKYMETFNSGTPSRKHSLPIQQQKHSTSQQAKKYEECPECDLKFEHLRDLTKHFSEVHEEDSEEDGEDELSNIASFLNSNTRNNSKVSQGSVQKKPPESVPQTLDGIRRISTLSGHPSMKSSCSPTVSKVSKLTNLPTQRNPQGIQNSKTEVKMIKDTLNQSSVKSKENPIMMPRVSEKIPPSRVPTPRQSYNQPISVTRPSSQTLNLAGKSPQVNSPKIPGAKSQVGPVSKEKLAERYRLEIQRKIALNVQNQSPGAKAQVTRSQESIKAQIKSSSTIPPTVNRRSVVSSPAPSPLMNRSQISGAGAAPSPSLHSQAKKPRPPPPVPKINFVPDTLSTSIQVR